MSNNPYSAANLDPELQSSSKIELPEFRGWLRLIAFGMIVGPLFGVVATLKGFWEFGIADVLQANRDWPGFLAAYVATTGLDVILTLFHIYIAWCFFKRYTTVPRMVVVFISCSLVLTFVSLIWFSYVYNDLAIEDIGRMVTQSIVALIWIPYFLISKNVKATFVVDPTTKELRPTPDNKVMNQSRA